MDNKTRIEKLAQQFASDKIAEASVIEGYITGYAAAVKEIIQQVEAYPMYPEEKQSWITYLKGLIEEPSVKV